MAPGKAEGLLGEAQKAYNETKYDDAAKLCKDAMAVVDKEMTGTPASKLRAEILLLHADVKDMMGNWIDAILYLDGVTQISVALGDARMGIEALIRAARLMSRKGKWQDAFKKYERAEAMSTKHGNHRLLGRALAGKGTVLWRQGKYLEALRHGEKAAEIGRKIRDDELIGEALGLISSVRFDQGDYAASIAANKEAISHMEKTTNYYELARLLNNVGETYKVKGDYKDGIEFLEKSLKVAEKIANRRIMGYALNNLAECSVRAGNATKAKKYAAKANEIFEGSEDKYARGNLQLVWGLIFAAQEDGAKADASFERAAALMKDMGIPYDTGVILYEHGKSLARRGKKDQARMILESAIQTFEVAGVKAMMVKAQKELESLA